MIDENCLELEQSGKTIMCVSYSGPRATMRARINVRTAPLLPLAQDPCGVPVRIFDSDHDWAIRTVCELVLLVAIVRLKVSLWLEIRSSVD